MAVFGDLWNEKPLIAGWTLRDTVQGKPFGHPSHPLFVHFPSALFPIAFVLDLISLVTADLTLTRAAFYNISFGLGFAALAAVTGLIDYLPMLGGKGDRAERNVRLGTFHMLCQVTAVSLMAGSLVVRAFDYDATQTPWAALALAGAAALIVGVGNYLGGVLVYKQGVRVGQEQPSTQEREDPA